MKKYPDHSSRIHNLNKLFHVIQKYEHEVIQALKKDLGKSEAESFLSEINFVYDEIKFSLKHLKKWMRPTKVPMPILYAIGKSWIMHEPKGLVLIIGPWNYPFQLLFSPLVGAIAAGNTCVLKPSEFAIETSRVIEKLVKENFSDDLIDVVLGGVEVTQNLLRKSWDHIFFTGSTQVGKIIMCAASEHLSPVTLELGGKSPCIVCEDANLDAAARRITWGKFYNAGQTCVAPDYILVAKKIEQELITRIKFYIQKFFGDDPKLSEDFGRIITVQHFHRLLKLIDLKKIVHGGESDEKKCYIAPTILQNVTENDSVMHEEIFGPILPVISFESLDKAITFIQSKDQPLALYLFTENHETEKKVLDEISFGGGCVNDTLIHLANPHLPFGGVGMSGMGAYHGKYSFDLFSHHKSIMKRSTRFDFSLRFPPMKNKLRLIKKLLF